MTSPKSDTLSEILSALLKWLMSGIASLLSIMAFADDQLPATQALASYTDQNSWQGIQHYLPKEYHLTETQRPKEEWWSWQGHTVHLDTYRNPQAKVKVILFHGVGTNGRQMSMILGYPLAQRGYETIAIDMPGYGLTQVKKGSKIRYDDWVQAGNDLIEAELQKDHRPIVLYGLSAGGMLTYHVAAKNKKVKGIVGMTFLDTSNKTVRDQVSLNKFMSRVGSPLAHVTAHTPLSALPMPMRWVSKMHRLVNNDAALQVFLKDKTSAGNSVSVKFLDSYLYYKNDTPPEQFDVCPILLTQPEQDRWTPLALSQPFLARIHQVPVDVVLLKNAGHYPLEQPGLEQMVNAIDAFYQKVTQ